MKITQAGDHLIIENPDEYVKRYLKSLPKVKYSKDEEVYYVHDKGQIYTYITEYLPLPISNANNVLRVNDYHIVVERPCPRVEKYLDKLINLKVAVIKEGGSNNIYHVYGNKFSEWVSCVVEVINGSD